MADDPITFREIADTVENVRLSRIEWLEAAGRARKAGREPSFDVPLTERSLPPLKAAAWVMERLAALEARDGTDAVKRLLMEA